MHFTVTFIIDVRRYIVENMMVGNPLQKKSLLSMFVLCACAQVEVYDASEKNKTAKEPVAIATPKVTKPTERAKKPVIKMVSTAKESSAKPPKTLNEGIASQRKQL